MGIFWTSTKMGIFRTERGISPQKSRCCFCPKKKTPTSGFVFWVPRWTAKFQGAISTPWWRANCDPWRRSRWKARPGWVGGGCVIEKMEWGGGSYKWPSIIWVTGVITPTSWVISPYFITNCFFGPSGRWGESGWPFFLRQQRLGREVNGWVWVICFFCRENSLIFFFRILKRWWDLVMNQTSLTSFLKFFTIWRHSDFWSHLLISPKHSSRATPPPKATEIATRNSWPY